MCKLTIPIIDLQKKLTPGESLLKTGVFEQTSKGGK
jgi:hypothetical protein